MSIVLTTVVPVLSSLPWSDTGAPDPSDKSIQPMGVLQAKIRDEVIGAPGTGDNQVVLVNIQLPVNFMYSLTDIACSFRTTGLVAANNWEDDAVCLFFDSAGPAIIDTIEYLMGYKSQLLASNTTSLRSYQPFGEIPKFLQVGGSTWQSVFTNNTDDDIVATMNLMARFLVFTVDQQYDVGVNTPQLVR